MQLEKEFSEKLIETALEAEKVCGFRPQKLVKDITQFGGVSVAKRSLSRNANSENFFLLKEAKRLDLSMEALITSNKFSPLFDDDEVNICFQLLCECGYFG